MKQYDKIIGRAPVIEDAIDQVLHAFSYRRRNNNTTAMEDFQVALGIDFFAVMIVSYDDYAPDTSQAPPARPRWIGQQPESGTVQEAKKSPYLVPAKKFIAEDHSDD